MSKLRWTNILRPFFDIFERLPKTQNFFFEKLPPGTAKTVFENPKGPPFGCWKIFFFESSFYQSHVMAFALTIPKWYNTWVLQIFFVNIWTKIFFKIFFFNFLKKYFQKIFAIPKLLLLLLNSNTVICITIIANCTTDCGTQ